MRYDPTSQAHRRELAARIVSNLEQLGFTRRDGGREAVYARKRESNVTIRVYTTIVNGEVRSVGEDAIRVALVYEGKPQDRGLASEMPVHRVGTIAAILGRLSERVDAAHAADLGRCRRCNGPAFLSRGGALVCAAICWERHVEPVAPTPTAPVVAAAPAHPAAPPAVERIPVMGRRGRNAPPAVAW